MDLVLLGAGASFGSVGAWPEPPPLGANLLRALMAHGETWKSLPVAAQTEFARDGLFEPGFDYVLRHHNHLVRDLLVEMALFFCRFRITPQSAYLTLLGKLKPKDVIATTNYDFLCEEAAGEVGNGYSYGLTAGGQAILKLHGSPNFFPDTGTNKFVKVQIITNRAHINAPPKILRYDDAIRTLADRPQFAPIMSLYNAGKLVISSPPLITAIQEDFRQALEAADRTFVVGLAPALHDTHIWDPLRKAKALYYINPDARHLEIVAKWGANNSSKPIIFGDTFVRFSELYPNIGPA